LHSKAGSVCGPGPQPESLRTISYRNAIFASKRNRQSAKNRSAENFCNKIVILGQV
jgi:hypothetical protein